MYVSLTRFLLLLPVYACPWIPSPKVATTQVRSLIVPAGHALTAQGVLMGHPPVFDFATCRCISNLSFYLLNTKHVLRNLCCGAPRHTLSDQDLKSSVTMRSPDHTVWAAFISPVLDLALQIYPANKRRDEHPAYAWACSPQTIQQVCGPPPAGQRKGFGLVARAGFGHHL